MKIGLTILFLLYGLITYSQSERKYIRKGNKLYEQKEYTDAEVQYRKSKEENSSLYEGTFNLGDALYKQKRYDEAGTYFKIAAEQTAEKKKKAKAYHNLGNSLLESRKIKESIEAYKNALKNDPNDLDTKYNLAYANSLLEKQQNQQQQNQDQNKDQQQDQQQDKQDQQKQQEQQKEQNAKKEEQQKQQQKESQLSKEDAERLLEALKNEEEKVQEKLKKEKMKVSKIYIEKDW